MNYSYAIIADASCDLSVELRTRFELDGSIKGYMSTPDADDVEGRYDLNDAELDAFYSSLKANKNGYKTSVSSVDSIVSCYEKYLEQGKDLLVISLSSGLSATYNIMVSAQKVVCEKYPGRKVIVVDSLRYSVAIGLLAIKACEFRANGMSLEDNAQKLEAIKRTVHQMGSLDDLFWIASKGRITHAKAFFGTIAGIKAMGDFDSNGMVTPLAKVSGFKKAYQTVIEYTKKTIVSANEQIILVAHSARREQAETLASHIKEKINPKEVIICNVYPISGINVGPGLVAAFYFGTEITDLQKEKDIMNKIVENL